MNINHALENRIMICAAIICGLIFSIDAQYGGSDVVTGYTNLEKPRFARTRDYSIDGNIWQNETSGHLDTQDNWYGFLASTPRTTLVHIEYHINFSYAKTFPYLLTYNDFTAPLIEPNMSCERKAGIIDVHLNMNKARTYLGPDTTHCSALVPRNEVICHGIVGYQVPTGRRFFLAVADCDSDNGINLQYHFQINNFRNTSWEQLRFSECTPFYHKVLFPNSFGVNSQKDILQGDDICYLFTLTKEVGTSCYQHAEYFACIAFFPPFQHNKTLFPCKRMCCDAKIGCGHVVKGIFKFSCQFFEDFSDSGLCIYKTIDCGPPVSPRDGRVAFNLTSLGEKAMYSCNEDRQLLGNTTRTCSYSGSWTGSAPVCVANTRSNRLTAIVTVACLGALAIILSLSAYIFRREIKILLYVKCGLKVWRKEETHREFDAFISSSDSDDNFVNEMERQLEVHHNPPFRLCLHSRDFIAGRTIVQNITEAVKRSTKTVCLLSKNFMQSGWCIFEFQLAYYMHIEQKRDCLVVVLVEDVSKEELHDDIRAYINSNTYLDCRNRLFWERLIYSLPEPRNNETMHGSQSNPNQERQPLLPV